jgi:hypothetical protein
MNSFERFEAILNHQKPDKLPFYFPTIACSVASELLGREVNSGGESLHFKEELSLLEGEQAHLEFVQQYQEDAIELNRKLHADIVRQTWRSSEKPSKKLDENTLLFGDENGPHKIKRFFPEQQSYGIVEDTTGFNDVEELTAALSKELLNHTKVSDDVLNEIYKDHLNFKKLADPYFPTIVTAVSLGIPMHSAVWLEATALEPELLSDYFMHSAEEALPHIKWLYRKGFKFINGGADIASQNGPVYSPASFQKIMVPALKRIADECSKFGMVYCYRTDGNIWAISDHLFGSAGVQCFGEVDRDAGMTVDKLRKAYPNLIILGNISSGTLHKGTAMDVREETRATLMESGGYNYIPGPSNAVMHGTPVENVYSMIDEIEKYKP